MKQKTFKPFKKIAWAVDPQQLEEHSHKTLLQSLKTIAKKDKAEVHAVYAYAPPKLTVAGSALKQLEGPFLKAAEIGLEKLAKKLKPLPYKFKLVSHHTQSHYIAPSELICQYAKKQKAGLIAISTHTNSALKRIILGSFSENVIHHSETPVLLCGPHTEKGLKSVKKILVPIDLSQVKTNQFKWITSFANHYNAEITLFHSMVDHMAPILQPLAMTLGASYPIQPELYSSIVENERMEFNKLIQKLQKNVKVTGIFSTDTGKISNLIQKESKKKKFDLIVMASHLGDFTSTFVGSVARQVIQNSNIPVLLVK